MDVSTVPPPHGTSRGPPTLSDKTFTRAPRTRTSAIVSPTPGRGRRMSPLLRRIGIEVPVVQAPMAGVSTPELAGIVLLATATNLGEGRAAAAAGIDAVVAQGYEAGGHRGVFDPDAPDDRLGTIALTRLLARKLDVPVVAAGGIMDGAGIAAVLA